MSLFTISKIPLYFNKLSLSINLRGMTLVPFCMVFVTVVNMCLGLASIEMQLLSYAVLGGVILSFVFMFAILCHTREMSRYGFLYFLFMVILIGLSLVSQTDFKNAIYISLTVWLNLMLFRYYRHRIKMLLCCYAIALTFCVYLNFVHLITHPMLWLIEDDKTNTGYLLGGNYNQMGCRMLIAMMVNCLCTRFSRLWLFNFVLLCIISIASLAMVGSMTSLSMFVVFVMFCLVPSSRLRKTSIYGLFTIFLLFQVFVVFNGRGLENNELAVYLIEDVLKKDMTFTYRTYMWDSALNMIEQSPLWGWGLPSPEWFNSHMSSFAIGPHNYILSILINGGIILLGLYIAICVMTWKAIRPFMENHLCQITVFAVVTLWTMALMEMYPHTIVFFALLLLYYYQYLPIPQTEKSE